VSPRARRIDLDDTGIIDDDTSNAVDCVVGLVLSDTIGPDTTVPISLILGEWVDSSGW